MRLRNQDSTGFSLVELMIAMVCTTIIVGAIYGLLSGGQSAFRREPEMTDRQQNVRLAMDIIMRDVAAAGANMPAFMQTFTTGLDGASLGACVDNEGNTVTCPVGPSAATTDELEMMTNTNGYGIEEACHYAGSESHAKMVSNTTNVTAGDVVMVFLDSGRWTLRAITGEPAQNNSSAGACTGHAHKQAPFNSGSSDTTGFNTSTGVCGGSAVPEGSEGTAACVSCETKEKGDTLPLPGNACCEPKTGCPPTPLNLAGDCCVVTGFLQGEMIRYRIRLGADGVPNLERFSSSRTSNFTTAGGRVFQVIARGIDDLQVVYTDANGTTSDNAPVVGQAKVAYGTLTRMVTVTLSSRSEAKNVAGAKTAASGPAALRGTLTSSGTPRAVLATLGTPIDKRASGWTGPTPWY